MKVETDKWTLIFKLSRGRTVMVGFTDSLQFGYSATYYDGMNRSVWVGPFFLYWNW